jgi:hypothetical protein
MFLALLASIIRLNMGTGKLYRLSDNQFMADINYQLYQRSESTEWSAELTLPSSLKINDNEIFIIKLEDGRKCLRKLRKKVNRAVSGIPPCFIYHATSLSQIE